MSHQATDIAAHIVEPVSDRAFRAMALLSTREEKAQVAVAVATNIAGWAAGVVIGLLAPGEDVPHGSDLLRWVADRIDEERAALRPHPSGGRERRSHAERGGLMDRAALAPRLLTEREAAAYLSLPVAAFRRLRLGVVTLGVLTRYDRQALDAYLDDVGGLRPNSATPVVDEAEAALARFLARSPHAAGNA